MKDFDVFDIKEKWFKEAAPQNYSSGSTAGVPARTPSIIIDNANDKLYVCAEADPTIYNTGWKKYKVDNGGGGGTTYEFALDFDTTTGQVVSTPDMSTVTLEAEDQVTVTLSDAMITVIESQGLTVAGSEFTGTASALQNPIIYPAASINIAANTIAVNFGKVASVADIFICLVMHNSGTGATIDTVMGETHTITITASQESGEDYYNLLPEQGGTDINSTLDVANVDLSSELKAVITGSGAIIDHDTFEVNASMATSNIVIDTTAPSQAGKTFTITSGSLYFDMGEFAHQGTVTMNGYIGMNSSTYAPGVVLNV